MTTSKTFNASINKIGQDREPITGDSFLFQEFNSREDAIKWLYDDKNHPAIDCDGFVLMIEDEIINTYVYGSNDNYIFTGYELPIV